MLRSWQLLALAPAMTDRALAIVLALGLVAVFVGLVVLVWTRWGQARPIAKCAGLSFAAHALLLIYAYSTQVLFDKPGSLFGQTVKVYVPDARDGEEAAPHPEVGEPKPWDQPGLDNAPDLNAAALSLVRADIAAPPIERALPTSPLPALPLPTLSQPKVEPPALARLPLASPKPPPSGFQSPPLPDPTPMPAPAEAINPGDLAAAAPMPSVAEQDLTNLLPDSSTGDGTANTQADPAANAAMTPAASGQAAESTPLPPPEVGTGQSYAASDATVPRRLGDGQAIAEALRARIIADRLKVAQQFGATPQTESAVAAALDWLAANQAADGRWDADAHGAGRETRTLDVDRQGAGARADTGITALALLALLGNGETHLKGKHRENVQHGLEFLLASQADSGSLAGQAELYAAMYCHGMATLALSEAYALTGDERLLPGLKKALRYTIDAQHAHGGWRYQPYDAGDMSQFGWQLMALKSAELAGIPIPAETRLRMTRFLRSVSAGRSKGLASYRPGERPSRTMTAEALACRFFLEAENAPAALAEAASYVGEEKPGEGQSNFYYWYYATLALFQRQGADWEAWNADLKRQLLHSQRFDGERRGSWDPDPLWGGYGGRVYSTAMGALCLEVYYRYLPLYGGKADAGDARLTDRPALTPLPR
jgi:hypothetical protein